MGHSTVSTLAMAAFLAAGFAEPKGVLASALSDSAIALHAQSDPALPNASHPPWADGDPGRVFVPGFVGPGRAAARRVDPFPGRSYGKLDAGACYRALDERSVSYAKVARARGVDAPVRLTGLLHGVDFHSEPDVHRERMAHEILDCRLALALDDFARMLSQRGVVEVIHLGMYRGDLPLPRGKRLRHHVAALAIDVAAFVKADGTRVIVQDDWHGRIGAQTCGERAQPWKPTPATVELRELLCEAAGAKLFHQMLTPNHDRRHADHFHLEVMRDTSWMMVE
jgi:hypothetical protein